MVGVSRPVREAVRRRIAGRTRTVGHWWSWRSVCDECGLDSGPWSSRWTADVSGLLHITRHHTDSKEIL